MILNNIYVTFTFSLTLNRHCYSRKGPGRERVLFLKVLVSCCCDRWQSCRVAMELKVWVDGVLRVVCGLSEKTSCQDVVIALAKAMGKPNFLLSAGVLFFSLRSHLCVPTSQKVLVIEQGGGRPGLEIPSCSLNQHQR